MLSAKKWWTAKGEDCIMAITNLGAFRYIGLDADIVTLPLNIEAGAIFDAFDTQRKFVFSGSAWIEFSGISDNSEIFVGQSTDTKPTSDINLGARVLENDTGREYFWNDKDWLYESTSDEGKGITALQPRSSFVQLFGDTFAIDKASTLYLLEDVSDSQGGTPLSNVGTIGFAEDPLLPLRGFDVPTFDGATQYFALLSEGKVEVGVGGFVASVQLKKTSVAAFETVFHYGDNTASQKWELSYDDSGIIRCSINDGTNSAIASDTIPNRTVDGEWHTVSMFVDRQPTVNLMYLFVDGEEVGRADISAVTLPLNAPGTNLTIGAAMNVGSAVLFYSGQQSNFSLYQADSADNTVPPDYNIPGIIFAGIRESANLGGFALTNDGALRLNNKFSISPSIGDYATSVLNLSEGLYDIIEIEKTGTSVIKIDGNIITTLTGIFLSAGTHLFRLENGLASALDMAAIELIKRDGENQGDDESSSGILFGDEIQQRSNGDPDLQLQTLMPYATRQKIVNPEVVGAFVEGDLFFKKGLYKVTQTYFGNALNSGIFETWIGGISLGQINTGLTTDIQQVTVFVFLEGGKSTVRREIVGIQNGTPNERWTSLKYELVTGKSNGDDVNIWAADSDQQAVVGNPWSLTIITQARFNIELRSATGAGNKTQWSRYFSGGTYKVDFMYEGFTTGQTVDIGIDDVANAIFDDFSTVAGSVTRNLKATTTVTISRGFHNITITQIATGTTRMQDLFFTKIGTVLNAEEDDSSDPVHGALVPLAKYLAPKDEASVTLELGGVEVSKYAKLVFTMAGRVDGSSDLKLRFNQINTSNTSFGNRNDGVANTPIQPSNATSELTLMTSTLLTNNNGRFAIEGTFPLISLDRLGGYTVGVGVNSVSVEDLQHQVISDITSIFEMLFTNVGGNNWFAGAFINVYGVKA